MLALQTEYGNLIQQNNHTDYYGRSLKSSTTKIVQKDTVNFLAQSPEDPLHAIRDTSPVIIADLCSLADVYYSKSGKYSQAAAYYKKALQYLYEFYGDGAVVVEVGQLLHNLGVNYGKSGEYSKAAECYYQALAIKAELRPDSRDPLPNLDNHHKHLNDAERVECLYREALTFYTKLDPSNQDIPKVRARLSELTSESTKEATKSIILPGAKTVPTVTEFPKKRFQTFDTIISRSHALNSGDIAKAQSCNNHGVLYAEMKQLDDAEECFNQALALYKHKSTQSIGIAHVLYNLGCTVIFLRTCIHNPAQRKHSISTPFYYQTIRI